MKNISLLLNVVLLLAVAYLYYLHFNNSKPASSIQTFSADSGNIVYINSDTLLEEYNYFNKLRLELETKQDSIDAMLKSKGRSLESEVNSYQERAPMMSAGQRAEAEEKLMMKQQQIMDLKQSFLEELAQDEAEMNDSIHANLNRYLKEYNKTKNYKFILGYQRGGGILLANDSLDITKEVLEGLNK